MCWLPHCLLLQSQSPISFWLIEQKKLMSWMWGKPFADAWITYIEWRTYVSTCFLIICLLTSQKVQKVRRHRKTWPVILCNQFAICRLVIVPTVTKLIPPPSFSGQISPCHSPPTFAKPKSVINMQLVTTCKLSLTTCQVVSCSFFRPTQLTAFLLNKSI